MRGQRKPGEREARKYDPRTPLARKRRDRIFHDTPLPKKWIKRWRKAARELEQ